MNPTEIDNVVTRVLRGEIDAFETLVHAYQQEVWKVVAAMLLNAQKTEDLVQQTFINAFQHLNRYERGRDFAAWLKEIARNQVRQEIRHCLREDRRLQFYYDQLMQTLDGQSSSEPEERLEQALRECKQKLPSSSAKLVELRYQSALNFGAIAALVGRTVEATRQQLARIRLTLRECIEKKLAKT